MSIFTNHTHASPFETSRQKHSYRSMRNSRLHCPFFLLFCSLSLSSVPRYEFEFSLSPYNSQTKISSHLFRELSPAALSSVPRDITLAIVDKATLAVQHKRHLVAPLCRKKSFPILILWVGGQAATARSAYKSFTQRIFHQPAHPRKQISMSNTHQQQVAVYKKKKMNRLSILARCQEIKST